MHYKDVTLAPDDIEWDHPGRSDEFDVIHGAVWADGEFEAYAERHGVESTLIILHRFHRVVANQLVERAVSNWASSPWAGRTIGLCRQLKYRRQQMRRQYERGNGQKALQALVERLNGEYPRAEWGGK